MAEHYLQLNQVDQHEVLEIAREKTGRPTHLLEKDVWVVWVLDTLFSSPLAADLTFKGGTSLSKAYRIIDRFSEDIDLTLDIRKLIDDLINGQGVFPANGSQARKWSKAVHQRLPIWIAKQAQPILAAAIARENLLVTLEIGGQGKDKLLLYYPALKQGTGYVAPVVTLEFGARATGQPHQIRTVDCDMQGYVENVSFPTARPVVMDAERTFWEKATAAHVYCAQGRIRGERYARHWHDLAALTRSDFFNRAITDRALAYEVAQHKSLFFPEKDSAGERVDYFSAVNGNLRIVPSGPARQALLQDYTLMLADQVMIGAALPFDVLMQTCAAIEAAANAAAASNFL